MKFWYFQYAALALAGSLGLLALALFPVLRSIAPRAQPQIQVEGAKSLTVGNGVFRYQSTGNGDEALLFLHGFNSQLSVWNSIWPFVGECGRSVRLDLAGYGGSAWTTDTYRLADQAQRVIAFMDALGLSRVTLVGVSMGGSLSAWLAAHYPERVKAVLLLAPSGYPGSLQYPGAFGRLLQAGVLNAVATHVADSGIYRRLYPESIALQALSVASSYGDAWAQALKNIRVPAVVVWSRGDTVVPFSYAEDVAKLIPASSFLPLSAKVGHDIPNARPELIGKIACLLHQAAQQKQILVEVKELLARNSDG